MRRSMRRALQRMVVQHATLVHTFAQVCHAARGQDVAARERPLARPILRPRDRAACFQWPWPGR
jgi:hypothetical protein